MVEAMSVEGWWDVSTGTSTGSIPVWWIHPHPLCPDGLEVRDPLNVL